jgi:lysozyme
MKISDNGLSLIKKSEGTKLTAYLDPISKLTVGTGHLVLASDNIQLGDTISQERSDELLRNDLKSAEDTVNNLVKVQLTQNMFDSLCDFVYNCGSENFHTSTLLRKINAGLFQEAAEEFQKWNKAGGKVLPGLVKRREAEKELFLS